MRLKVSDGHGAGYEVQPTELDYLLDGVGLGRLHELLIARRPKTSTCPVCGWTRAQLSRTGLVGCGVCYDVLVD